MQYQVPQFIEIEDKIFGPFTLKQFIYLAGGAGVCLMCFTLLPFYIAVIIAGPFVALALALAFYKVNDRPFIIALEHGFKYYLRSKLYLWKPRDQASREQLSGASNAESSNLTAESSITLPNLSDSRLKDLSWSLNIKDRTEAGVVDPERPDMAV